MNAICSKIKNILGGWHNLPVKAMSVLYDRFVMVTKELLGVDLQICKRMCQLREIVPTKCQEYQKEEIEQ